MTWGELTGSTALALKPGRVLEDRIKKPGARSQGCDPAGVGRGVDTGHHSSADAPPGSSEPGSSLPRYIVGAPALLPGPKATFLSPKVGPEQGWRRLWLSIRLIGGGVGNSHFTVVKFISLSSLRQF